MNAYILYSVNSDDIIIVSLIARKLGDKKINTIAGQNLESSELDESTKYRIKNSDIMIGIITHQGKQKDLVISGCKFAQENKIPYFLLIESRIPVPKDFTGDFIRFNRNNPVPAIEKIHERIDPKNLKIAEMSADFWIWSITGATVSNVINGLSLAGKHS